MNHVEREPVLPIAFSLFHLAQMEDTATLLSGAGTPIYDDSWATRIGLVIPDHGKHRSVDEMVHQRIGDYDAFCEYMALVFAKTERWLADLDPATLDEVLVRPPVPAPVRLDLQCPRRRRARDHPPGRHRVLGLPARPAAHGRDRARAGPRRAPGHDLVSQPAGTEWSLADVDGTRVFGTRWSPERPRAVVQIAHGWAEHRGRYARLAAALGAAGYAVWADDHLGHGETGANAGGLGDLGPRGMAGVVDAVHAVTRRIHDEERGLPLCLLGHSWGSFMAQRFVREWSGEIDALVLTGTTRREPGAGRQRAEPTAGAGRYDWLTRDAAKSPPTRPTRGAGSRP